MKTKVVLFVFCIQYFVASIVSSAVDAACNLSDTLPYEKNIYNSWKKWQECMKKNGVDVTSSYTANPLANVSGGLKRGWAYTGSYGIFATFDLEKMWGRKGLEFYAAFGWRAGSNLATKVGNQFPPAQVYGNQTWWLDQFFFQQTFCEGKLKAKVGRIESGDDFLQSPLY